MKQNGVSKEICLEDNALTHHAQQRMNMRNFSSADVNDVLSYGRKVYTRGAIIYAIGRKEISQCAACGIDLSNLDGLQAVCSSDGIIITVYRNRDFRGLRPRCRRLH